MLYVQFDAEASVASRLAPPDGVMLALRARRLGDVLDGLALRAGSRWPRWCRWAGRTWPRSTRCSSSAPASARRAPSTSPRCLPTLCQGQDAEESSLDLLKAADRDRE